VQDPSERRGRDLTKRIGSALTGRISGDGDAGTTQSTPTAADTKPEEYSATEKSFKDKRKDLAKFGKVT